tara:strand:- start:461 stop:673 length:213 start_codon:yes stop_codon:yes gene_type:complete
MTSSEFTLWLHGYLEALETEGIEKIKIKNIREKMSEIKNNKNYQERVVYSPNTNLQPDRYAQPQTPTARK